MSLLIRLLSLFLYAAAWCAGRLPLRLQLWLGDAFGRVAHLRNTREGKVARRNLELIAAQMPAVERERLVGAVLRQTGRNALESLRIWTRPRADNLALVAAVHGADLLAAAAAAGRGVIIAAPHYGNIEMVVEYMAARGPFALVYKPPNNRAGDGFLRLARGKHNVALVPAEASAMRPLLRTLQAGDAVGITPDQQPKEGGGEFAPNGAPTAASTCTSRRPMPTSRTPTSASRRGR
jgi:KDO2-lipid IV(A) lauroyltransferase